jgi:hypothetical protein
LMKNNMFSFIINNLINKFHQFEKNKIKIWDIKILKSILILLLKNYSHLLYMNNKI